MFLSNKNYVWRVFILRYDELQIGAKKFNSEGLNSIKYKIHALDRKVLYTWILTELKHDSVE